MKLVPAVPFHSYSIFRPTTQLFRFNQLLSKNEKELELKKPKWHKHFRAVLDGREVTSQRNATAADGCEAQPLQATPELCNIEDVLYFFCPKKASDKYLPDLGKERAWMHQKTLREEMLNLFCPMFENKRSSHHSVCQRYCTCYWPSKLSLLT